MHKVPHKTMHKTAQIAQANLHKTPPLRSRGVCASAQSNDLVQQPEQPTAERVRAAMPPLLAYLADDARARFAARLTFLETPDLTRGNPAQMTAGVVPVKYLPPGDRRSTHAPR